ncbi:RHS repeat-associated core domain-containing protein [Photorhabdus tasmaniensis]|uniref:RHS repeat-associated core domain-containing protein n=1 Tax=Photorhabdus tasmaniensis TaxID=1004159 RepID=UPI001F60870D|nr:RHS repeat-associated core domain-containing protein [Photorhabdus tasmaniensis]
MRFSRKYEDKKSGLFYNRFRYYSPETGQYLSPDPIELSGGLNLYTYAPNLLTWIDPWGLSDEPIGSENNLFSSSGAARRDAMRHGGYSYKSTPRKSITK